MHSHELAKKLLLMPNKTVFIKIDKTKADCDMALWNIKDVEMCLCGSEIILTHEDF